MDQSHQWICGALKDTVMRAGAAALCMMLAAAMVASTAMAVDGHKSQPTDVITAKTLDGVIIHGQSYFGDLDADAPLVLLFHQGGANGRGEYAPIAPWLNENGFRAIAWDQRAGGGTFGSVNRTVEGLAEGTPNGYCDAYPDLQAAVDYVMDKGLAERVIVWGSSYSGALVFQLAAKNPNAVSGVLAFSPASGGPLANCRAAQWIDGVTVPKLVMRPASEMEIPSAQNQRDVMVANGSAFYVVDEGVHGSSMLVDDRTEANMSAARTRVLEWLKNAL